MFDMGIFEIVIFFVIALFFSSISYYLGRTKTNNPVIAALIGFMLSIFPPFSLIYIVVLLLSKNVVISSEPAG